MHKSWEPIVKKAYDELDNEYKEFLKSSTNYFPDFDNMFNAFSLPKENTKYILFGQDPYPRKESAIGYAFIDGAVKNMFSVDGLSKEVNRATSLRNFIKMCLVAQKLISQEAKKEEIAKLDKSQFIDSIDQFKDNLLKNGVLLLNMGLVFEEKGKSRFHVKQWQPFIRSLLNQLKNEEIELILFGNISKEVDKFDVGLKKHLFQHPYNVSFINNNAAQELFLPMKLLYK